VARQQRLALEERGLDLNLELAAAPVRDINNRLRVQRTDASGCVVRRASRVLVRQACAAHHVGGLQARAQRSLELGGGRH
jgi:hypothetical protein